MDLSRWEVFERKRVYTELYGHLSIVIETANTRIQIPYAELFTCSKKRLSEILKLAASCGGWKLINHETGEQL